MMRNYNLENITEEQAEMLEKFLKENKMEATITDNCYEVAIRDIVHTQLENIAEYLVYEDDNEKRVEILKNIDQKEMIDHLYRGVGLDIFEKSESIVEDIINSIIEEKPMPGYEDILKN